MCAWKQCRLRVLAEAQRADKKKSYSHISRGCCVLEHRERRNTRLRKILLEIQVKRLGRVEKKESA